MVFILKYLIHNVVKLKKNIKRNILQYFAPEENSCSLKIIYLKKECPVIWLKFQGICTKVINKELFH